MIQKPDSWGRVVGVTILLEAIMIACAVLWVAFYSMVIAPGESPEFYEEYANRSSAFVALIVGPVVFGLTAFLLRRRYGEPGKNDMWWILFLCLFLDLVVVLAVAVADEMLYSILLWIVNAVAKGAGVWVGFRMAGRKQ